MTGGGSEQRCLEEYLYMHYHKWNSCEYFEQEHFLTQMARYNVPVYYLH